MAEGPFGGWPDTGARSIGGTGVNVGILPKAMEDRAIQALQRDPREIKNAGKELQAYQRKKALELADFKANLDREYEEMLNRITGGPNVNAPGAQVGGPWGLPIANPGGPFSGVR